MLVIADRRHAILGHIIRLLEQTPAHTVLQHVINCHKWESPCNRLEASNRSTTENMATTGSLHTQE